MMKFKNFFACSYLLFVSLTLMLKIVTINCEASFPMAIYDSLYAPAPKDSIFMSPIGLKASLELAAIGAGGSTRRQILETIDSSDEILTQNIKLLSGLKIFQQQQRIYEMEHFVGDDFRKIVSPAYTFEDATFGSLATKKMINNFVKEATKNEVSQIFSKSLNKKTVAAMVSALSLNAKWKTKFTSTVVRSFRKPMVHQYGDFMFANLTDLNAAVLQLEFQQKDLQLLVFQPNDNDLTRLGEQLLNVSLPEFSRQLKSTYMSLYFPIINEIKMSRSLVDGLQSLGMHRAFEQNANFGRLVDYEFSNPKAFLKEVRQHTKFESGRKGANFVAVTGLQWDAVENAEGRPVECKNDQYSTEFADPSEVTESVDLVVMNKHAPHYYFENKLFMALILKNDVLFVGTVAKD